MKMAPCHRMDTALIGALVHDLRQLKEDVLGQIDLIAGEFNYKQSMNEDTAEQKALVTSTIDRAIAALTDRAEPRAAR